VHYVPSVVDLLELKLFSFELKICDYISNLVIMSLQVSALVPFCCHIDCIQWLPVEMILNFCELFL